MIARLIHACIANRVLVLVAAALLAVPYAGWIGFAALLSEELWRRNR